MSLMQKIRDKQLEARKNGLKALAPLYTTLLGEAAAIGKNAGNRETTDAEVVAVVKKFIKNMDQSLEDMKERSATAGIALFEEQVAEAAKIFEREKAALSEFLPQQLDEVALKAAILNIKNEVGATSQKDMGKVMARLKTDFDGQYDGKLASALVKEALA